MDMRGHVQSIALWVVALVAGWSLLATPALAQETCLQCHETEGLSFTLPSGESIPVTVKGKDLADSVHRDLSCTTCHPEQTKIPHPPLAARTAREFRVTSAQICQGCHPDAASEYRQSVHGRGLRLGLADVPTCQSCHTAHAVRPAKDPAFRNNIPLVCGNCHGDPRIASKYGMKEVYQTYATEFHGVTTFFYRVTKPQEVSPAAVCYDCHGIHDVKAVDAPDSPVNKQNLLATCRKCHPRAGPLFASAWLEHERPAPGKATLVYLVSLFYTILIPSVVAFLGVHTALDLWRWLMDRLEERRK